MRIDCQTYGHWKDLLICAMSCPYTHRCKQFKRWKEDEDNQEALWARVMNYITKHPHHPYELILTPSSTKQRRNTEDNAMKRFVCIQEDDISLLTEEEITQQLLQGTMFDEIFELGRAMELQIRLVPSKKAKAKKDKPKADAKADAKAEDVSNGAAKSRSKRSKKSTQAAVN